jgi:hypothetical protein
VNYEDFILSSRVSDQTRELLLKRARLDTSNYIPQALTPDQLTTLRAMTARIVPQDSANSEIMIDLAARIDIKLATGKGDGWRYAVLPPDIQAYQTGLLCLDECARKLSAVPYDRLTAEAQDALLTSMADGRLQSPHFDMKLWFEDVRADATQLFVSHPQTLARMGYGGIGDNEHGFVQFGLGQRESWEPEPTRK